MNEIKLIIQTNQKKIKYICIVNIHDGLSTTQRSDNIINYIHIILMYVMHPKPYMKPWWPASGVTRLYYNHEDDDRGDLRR